jgi:hypothetical protein
MFSETTLLGQQRVVYFLSDLFNSGTRVTTRWNLRIHELELNCFELQQQKEYGVCRILGSNIGGYEKFCLMVATSCSTSKASRHFGEEYYFHVQGRRKSWLRNYRESSRSYFSEHRTEYLELITLLHGILMYAYASGHVLLLTVCVKFGRGELVAFSCWQTATNAGLCASFSNKHTGDGNFRLVFNFCIHSKVTLSAVVVKEIAVTFIMALPIVFLYEMKDVCAPIFKYEKYRTQSRCSNHSTWFLVSDDESNDAEYLFLQLVRLIDLVSALLAEAFAIRR